MILVGSSPGEVSEFVGKAIDKGCVGGMWLRCGYICQQGQFSCHSMTLFCTDSTQLVGAQRGTKVRSTVWGDVHLRLLPCLRKVLFLSDQPRFVGICVITETGA